MAVGTSEVVEFRRDWFRFHPGCLPLGWLLRHCEGTPWVRFHALPGSKRYADDQSERNEVLSRGSTLGDELFGIDQPCWFIEAEVGGPSSLREAALSGSETDDPEGPIWNFYAARDRWRAESRDDILLEVANDGPQRAIWMRPDNGAVFAPYDGGFDLFQHRGML